MSILSGSIIFISVFLVLFRANKHFISVRKLITIYPPGLSDRGKAEYDAITEWKITGDTDKLVKFLNDHKVYLTCARSLGWTESGRIWFMNDAYEGVEMTIDGEYLQTSGGWSKSTDKQRALFAANRYFIQNVAPIILSSPATSWHKPGDICTEYCCSYSKRD